MNFLGIAPQNTVAEGLLALSEEEVRVQIKAEHKQQQEANHAYSAKVQAMEARNSH